MSANTLLAQDDKLRSLAMAIARNKVGADRPVQEVLLAEFVSEQEFLQVMDDPVFKRYVQGFVKEFEQNGVSFSQKCRVLAEDAITHLYHMARDVDVPAAARVKAVENLVDWGGLAPKKTDDGQNTRPAFSITIQLPNAAPMTLESPASTQSDPFKEPLPPPIEGVYTTAEHVDPDYA